MPTISFRPQERAIDTIRKALLEPAPFPALKAAITDLVSWVPGLDTSARSTLVKLVLVFLVAVVKERPGAGLDGMYSPLESMCGSSVTLQKFCATLDARGGQYTAETARDRTRQTCTLWTSEIIIIATLLRTYQHPSNSVTIPGRNMFLGSAPTTDETAANRFLYSNVQLLLYGILFLRYETALEGIQVSRRKLIEDNFSIAIASFYSDFVLLQKLKNEPEDPRYGTIEAWEALYLKVVDYYLHPRAQFVGPTNIRRYLAPDRVADIQSCLYWHILAQSDRLEEVNVERLIRCLTASRFLPALFSMLFRFVGMSAAGSMILQALPSVLQPDLSQAGVMIMILIPYLTGEGMWAAVNVVNNVVEAGLSRPSNSVIDNTARIVYRTEPGALPFHAIADQPINPPYIEHVQSRDGAFEAMFRVVEFPLVVTSDAGSDPAPAVIDETVRRMQMQRDCKYSPLVSDSWDEVPVNRYYGPDADGRCFDVSELLESFESSLGAGLNTNPYPQYPNDPFNRTAFTMQQIQELTTKMQQAGLRLTPRFTLFLGWMRKWRSDMRSNMERNGATSEQIEAALSAAQAKLERDGFSFSQRSELSDIFRPYHEAIRFEEHLSTQPDPLYPYELDYVRRIRVGVPVDKLLSFARNLSEMTIPLPPRFAVLIRWLQALPSHQRSTLERQGRFSSSQRAELLRLFSSESQSGGGILDWMRGKTTSSADSPGESYLSSFKKMLQRGYRREPLSVEVQRAILAANGSKTMQRPLNSPADRDYPESHFIRTVIDIAPTSATITLTKDNETEVNAPLPLQEVAAMQHLVLKSTPDPSRDQQPVSRTPRIPATSVPSVSSEPSLLSTSRTAHGEAFVNDYPYTAKLRQQRRTSRSRSRKRTTVRRRSRSLGSRRFRKRGTGRR